MFFTLIKAATAIIKAVTGGGAKAPAAPKKPVTIKAPAPPPPKLLQVNPYIAKWNDTPAQRQAGMAANNNVAAYNKNISAQNAAAAAADAARKAEAARKEAARKAADAKLNQFRNFSKNLLGQASKIAKDSLKNWFGIDVRTPEEKKAAEKTKTPEQKELDQYAKITKEYEEKAKNLLNQQKKKPTKMGFFDTVFDAFGGQTRREENARSFAQKELQNLSTTQIKKYEEKAKWFQSEQAKKTQQLKAKQAQGKLTQAEIDQYSKWEDDNIGTLKYMRAATEGSLKGYDAGSKAEINTVPGKVGSWFNKNVVNGVPGQAIGGLWKYTLGEGGKNVPSIITAPSRALNTIGNALGINKEKYYYGGAVDKSKSTNFLDAWQDSHNQRNWNIGNASNTYNVKTDIDSSYKDALNLYKQKKESNKYLTWNKNKLPTKQQWLDEKLDNGRTRKQNYYEGKGLSDRKAQADMANNTMEFFLDPALALGKLGKGAKFVAGATSKATKMDQAFAKAKGFMATSDSKIAKSGRWLVSEHKDFNARKSDFIKAEIDDIKAKQPLIAADVEKWQKNKEFIKVAEKNKIAQATMDEFGGLSKKDAKTFQELVRSNGDWDLVKNSHKYDAGKREYLEMMANKWRANSDTLHKLENEKGIATPFRQNYIPQYRNKYSLTRIVENKNAQKGSGDWWFTKPQAPGLQSKNKLIKSMAARQYYSKLARQDMPVLRNFRAGHEDIARNIDRITHVNDHVKKTGWEKIMTPASVPIKAWKQSVLKYRPAWTVNNVLYNTQATVLSSGVRGVLRQGKLTKPLEFDIAAKNVPDEVRSKLVNEIGSSTYAGTNKFKKFDSKLNKFYNRVEDIPRLAAYKELKSQGLGDAAAVKRINRYHLDYTVKNIERPIKTVLPFYTFQKGVAKAAVSMPFDKPMAAKFYNQVDKYQQNAYDQDFESMRPELKKQGYSDQDIDGFKKENAKYYDGRLKVGNKYITTPFNVFSEKGLSSMGWNPYLAAYGESSAAVDSYGNKIGGDDANLMNRLSTKFPQLEIGKKALKAFDVATGKTKPRKAWISTEGSLGYGMTKEQQGYDKNKSNYKESMDPRAKLGQDIGAFFGAPRAMDFDKNRFIETKKVSKIAEEYFALDRDLEYAERQKQEAAIFKKHGVTADQFYDGILTKNDTEFTKGVKAQRKTARAEDQELYDWYHSQEPGKKNVAATKKLRELVEQRYFEKNPFHKYKFDWMTSDSVARADKQIEKEKSGAKWVKVGDKFVLKTQKQLAYEHAASTGDWSGYRKSFGDTRKTSQKQLAYAKAKASGDWSGYRAKYGTKSTKRGIEYGGKFFKTTESLARYKEGQFWKQYSDATKEDRRKLLADNPQFNNRKDWTKDQWDASKLEKKNKTLQNVNFNKYFTSSKTRISSNLPVKRTKSRSIKYVMK